MNIEEMIKDELKSALDYYSWSLELDGLTKSISKRFYEISKEELSHADLWISLFKASGNSKYENYVKEYEEAYKVIYGGGKDE